MIFPSEGMLNKATSIHLYIYISIHLYIYTRRTENFKLLPTFSLVEELNTKGIKCITEEEPC